MNNAFQRHNDRSDNLSPNESIVHNPTIQKIKETIQILIYHIAQFSLQDEVSDKTKISFIFDQNCFINRETFVNIFRCYINL